MREGERLSGDGQAGTLSPVLHHLNIPQEMYKLEPPLSWDTLVHTLSQTHLIVGALLC
jgi:hypothetical protein